VADKIRQAIDEVELEISNPDRCVLDPDVKEKLANKIAAFLAKGVGNPSVVYDLLKKAHEDGKYPANTPQGRGDNIRNYTDRIMAMFSVSSGTLKLKTDGTKKMLIMAQPEEPSGTAKAMQYEQEDIAPPKSADRRAAETMNG
jgi:hypothetical protein